MWLPRNVSGEWLLAPVSPAARGKKWRNLNAGPKTAHAQCRPSAWGRVCYQGGWGTSISHLFPFGRAWTCLYAGQSVSRMQAARARVWQRTPASAPLEGTNVLVLQFCLYDLWHQRLMSTILSRAVPFSSIARLSEVVLRGFGPLKWSSHIFNYNSGPTLVWGHLLRLTIYLLSQLSCPMSPSVFLFLPLSPHVSPYLLIFPLLIIIQTVYRNKN